MKIKYSKIKKFNLVTGEDLLGLQDKLESTSDMFERLNILEKLSLGLYLIDAYPLDSASSEYKRLMESDDARYAIIDNVDLDELLKGVVG